MAKLLYSDILKSDGRLRFFDSNYFVQAKSIAVQSCTRLKPDAWPSPRPKLRDVAIPQVIKDKNPEFKINQILF